MGQHNRLYFQSDFLGLGGIDRTDKSSIGEEHSPSNDGRVGYRLIFDLPPRMNAVSNSNEQSKKSPVNANVEEEFYLKQRKRSSKEHTEIEAEPRCNGLLSAKRNPLNGFLRDVMACVKPKVQ
ncbi:hypothetical protein EV198_3460 [Roseivirga ehrenbergii]|uniref:Uncharacterized protein n=1 Tax=Roseivirga ehrenbergii (strain DSM 102268 / JCM 13514 / KCTC 12282 / NCIMB 14502 / KMM 6017) TaxID=279360 RepID=A0A150WXW5_ROSEK|nr:hypothetical protein [Roseivirga ehrenbergii]KYG71325.1 hypothetical protein MB14_11145 [Roseivirga ehrenbergii]TCK99630.1 hypothetical protein EV198_3460 [Roseivirga ehrenbergii]